MERAGIKDGALGGARARAANAVSNAPLKVGMLDDGRHQRLQVLGHGGARALGKRRAARRETGAQWRGAMKRGRTNQRRKETLCSED